MQVIIETMGCFVYELTIIVNQWHRILIRKGNQDILLLDKEISQGATVK
jgi:hypothetical protein